MKVIDAGHKYEVEIYDDKRHVRPQVITFMKRMGPGYPGNIGSHAGTNCQELLRVLINRVEYLNEQEHHDNNLSIIRMLEQSLWLFEDRAASRHGIEGFDFVPANIELEPTCKICGHVDCLGHETRTRKK